MKPIAKIMFGFLLVPLLVGLACQLGSPPALPDVDLNAAGTQAANTVATAQAAAGNLDGLAETAAAVAATAEVLAGTVAAQGGDALATAQAAATLIPPVTVDATSLRDKINNLQPDENGNVTVTFTDDELNQAITFQQQTQEGGQVAMQNAAVVFTDGSIILTGQVTTPVTAQFTVVFRPFIANGTLQFDVVSATVGNVNVPPALLNSAEATLNNTLGAALSQLPTGVTLTSVNVSEGLLTVVGNR